MAPEALPTNPSNPLPSRATSNDISLLLASKANRLRRSALFRNLSASSPSNSTAAKPATHNSQADDSSVFTPGGQNSGIGYVPTGTDKGKANDAATLALRNKLLGKRKGRGDGVVGGKKGWDSEEDEDEGRSGLGKTKKVKKQRIQDEELLETSEPEPEHETAVEDTTNVEEDTTRHAPTRLAEAATGEQLKRTKPKKKKKKGKNKTKED